MPKQLLSGISEYSICVSASPTASDGYRKRDVKPAFLAFTSFRRAKLQHEKYAMSAARDRWYEPNIEVSEAIERCMCRNIHPGAR